MFFGMILGVMQKQFSKVFIGVIIGVVFFYFQNLLLYIVDFGYQEIREERDRVSSLLF